MSLAKRILDEANEDITTTEIYKLFMNNVDNIIAGLELLSKNFENAHSDTEIEDTENFGILHKAVSELCNELDRNGFTYIPQSIDIKKDKYSKVLNNYKEYYESLQDEFGPEDLEIMNTNSKDLLNLLDKIYSN